MCVCVCVCGHYHLIMRNIDDHNYADHWPTRKLQNPNWDAFNHASPIKVLQLLHSAKLR